MCGIGITVVPSLPKAVKRVRLSYPAFAHCFVGRLSGKFPLLFPLGIAWGLFLVDWTIVAPSTQSTRCHDASVCLSDTGWIMPGIKETVVEVSEKFLNRHDRKRAPELKETGHNISQIAEIMGRTRPLVNRLLNPEHQYYQTATTRAEMHRRMKLYERLAV